MNYRSRPSPPDLGRPRPRARHARRRRPGRTALTFLSAGVLLSLVATACAQEVKTASGPPPAQRQAQITAPTHAHQRTTTSPTNPGASPTTVPTDSPALGHDSTSSALPTSQPVATTTTTTAAAANGGAFHGVFEFAGNNVAADAANPDLAGVVLVYYWSQIEPSKGVFDWSVIDNDMAPWVAAGKKVILRISTSGSASWDPPYSGAGTPAWVYRDGTRAINDDGETLPVYWDQAYLTDYQAFVRNFGLRFDGSPNVAFVEAGIGMGGETLPETNASGSGIAAWQHDGYTDAIWLTTVEKIASFFETSFHQTPIFPLVDMTFFDGSTPSYESLMSWFRAVPNWGLQYDGLTSTQKLSAQWTGRSVALEQRYATSTSHDCLCDDIANGLNNLHGNYLLIYRSDIVAPANASYLRLAAARAKPS